MGSGLDDLISEGLISEVLARLKSGKEADVYAVRYRGQVVAAKVYKDRATRSFKNNAVYKEGRSVRSSRSQRAMDKGTRFGRDAAEDAWKTAEVDALYKLHAAGVRVPTPVMFLEGVLLMELVLDAEGDAAPRLIDTQLTPRDASAAYHDMLSQLVRILSCDLIHGDLSPYNVLWAAKGPTIIDFPQVISASHNSSSETFFLRDAHNILGWFARIDPSLHARSTDPAEIWWAYRTRELTPDFMPTGRPRHRPQRPRLEGLIPPRTGQDPRGGHEGRGGHDPRGAQARGGPRPANGAPFRPRMPGPPPAHGGPPGGGRRGPPPPAAGPGRGAPGPQRAQHGPEVIVRNRRPLDAAVSGPVDPAVVSASEGGSAGTEAGPRRRRRHRR